MKPTTSILFIILAFSLACVSTQQPTDLHEYGLKGQVKSVTTTRYFDLENNNGEWILDDTKINGTYKMSFNERGNITEVKEYYTQDGFEQIRTTKIEFKDNLKTKFVQTNSDGQQVGLGTYEWIDNYHYTLMVTESGEITSESHYTLDENFRDLNGRYKWSQGDSIFLFESYTNNLAKNGEVISATFTDHLTDSTFVIILTNKEKDEQGNLTKIALVYEKTGLLKKLVVKKIEYYK